MLTVDFDRLGVAPGIRFLDVGCGSGRHSGEALRRGAQVTAVDSSAAELEKARGLLSAMTAAGEAAPGAGFELIVADATRLPLPSASFDVVVVSEVFEHIPGDTQAMAETSRVLKPGGRAAVSVPRWWPEHVCWALSSEYRTSPGGHVRVYRADELVGRLEQAGLAVEATGHAHALHSPYWWLKCALGVQRDTAFIVRQYHRFLVWDIMRRPAWVGALERALNPVLGKSFVVYLTKPTEATAAA